MKIESLKKQEPVNRIRLLFFLSFFIALLGCATTGRESAVQAPRNPEWAVPITMDGVPNFNKVNDTLYRSAQPTEIGMRNLEKMGIKTIINLRAFHDDKDEVQGTGIKRIDIPMMAGSIKDEDVIKALKYMTTENEGPYLVHCLHGADRTGVVNAMYRIVHDNWDKQKAIAEMTNGGYGFHEVWNNIIVYIEEANVGKIKSAVAAR